MAYRFNVNEQRCINCGICMDLCPVHCLDVTRSSRSDGPLVFGVEEVSQGYLGWFVQHFTSNTNPGVALIIMWVARVSALGVIGWLFIRIWQNITRSFTKSEVPKEKPVHKNGYLYYRSN